MINIYNNICNSFFERNKSIHKLISIVFLFSLVIVFLTVSCKKPEVETEETMTVTETTVMETVPETTPEVIDTVEEQKFIAEYTIQSGDTLGKIARDFYGDDSQPYWELIFEANKDIIEDAGLIYPGQIIKIPELPEEMN